MGFRWSLVQIQSPRPVLMTKSCSLSGMFSFRSRSWLFVFGEPAIKEFQKSSPLVYAGGCLGGVAKSGEVFLAGHYGIATSVGLSKPFFMVFSNLVWGLFTEIFLQITVGN